MSEKKLNAAAAAFSVPATTTTTTPVVTSLNPNVPVWSPGKEFIPSSAAKTTSQPPASVPTAALTPLSKEFIPPTVPGVPPIVEPKAPVWPKVKSEPLRAEPAPAAAKQATPAPKAEAPVAQATKPAPGSKPAAPTEAPITFGAFNNQSIEKKPDTSTPVPAAAPAPSQPAGAASPPAVPVDSKAETSAKPTWGAAPKSFAQMLATNSATPADTPVQMTRRNPPPSATPAVQPAAKSSTEKVVAGDKKDSNRRDKGKKGDKEKSDKGKGNGRDKGGKGQNSKQAPQQKNQQPQQQTPKVVPEPTPAQAVHGLNASDFVPLVQSPTPVVEANPNVPSFAAAAAKPKQVPVPVPVPASVPNSTPKTAVVAAKPVVVKPKEAPAPAPAPAAAQPAPAQKPVSVPVVPKPAAVTPAVTAPELAPLSPIAEVPAAPAAEDKQTAAPEPAAAGAAEDGWRQPRSLRPGGGGPLNTNRADALGPTDRVTTPSSASPSNANSDGRWSRAVLPPGPTEDASKEWATASGATRFNFTDLMELRETNTEPPAELNLKLPIIHRYLHKQAEEETRRLAMEKGSKHGGGPLRPKGPPKQYEKPKWAAGTNEGEAAEVMRKALFILNKLTVEKFNRLSDEFLQVGFTSVPLLEGAIDIIVDKAQMEHHFGAMYADLCLKLAKTPLAELGEADKGKQFKKSLLQRCQQEFEKDQKEILDKLGEMEDVDERDAAILLTRKRYLGHMKFVGQLFRVQLLSDKIMHICVQELFGDPDEPDEEKIQCLCTLLTTIGAQLEEAAVSKPDKAKLMKKYLKELTSLSTSQKISSRIRFMCKDLLEMRTNGWNARREEETAKTLSQIHQEAQREQNQKAAGGGNSSPRTGNNTPRGGNTRGGSSTPRNGVQDVRFAAPADDGWAQVKPGARGGGGGNKARTNTPAAPANNNNNNPKPQGGGFHAFAEKERKDKEMKKERKEKKEMKKDSKKDSSKKESSDDAAAAAAPEFTKTPEEYAKSCKAEIEQHLNGGTAQEVFDSIKEFGAPVPKAHVALMVSAVLDDVFTKYATDAKVDMVAALLVELVKQGLVDKAGVSAGFSKFTEGFEDYSVDAPKSASWFPQMINSLVNAGVLTLKCLSDANGAFKESWKMDEFCFATKFTVKLLASSTQSPKALLATAGIDLKALAENDTALDALLAEYKVSI